jgi:hypothetical protein
LLVVTCCLSLLSGLLLCWFRYILISEKLLVSSFGGN